MVNRKIFFQEYKNNIDPDRKLTQQEVDALDEFLSFVDPVLGQMQMNQWAYFFATVFHETHATFKPVKEAYYLQDKYKWTDAQYLAWAKRNFRYFPYYGMGYVQTTWLRNYEKYSKLFGIDFVNHPELMMVPKYSFKVSIHGFINGGFTGKKISDYVNKDKTDYRNARRVINGTDKMDLIASYAKIFENILRKSIIR